MTEPAIVEVPAERLHQLRPLWQALYEHQTAITPHLHDRQVPFEQSWEGRLALEREWLQAEPDSFVLAAEQEGGYLGYAFVRVMPDHRFAVSWSASSPLAELATLVVLPRARGRGIGTALLDAVEDRLRALDVADMVIAVITTNTEAMRLYERRGALPFITQLVHRVGPSSSSETPGAGPHGRSGRDGDSSSVA